MEFNITITKEEPFEAAKQWRDHILRKNRSIKALIMTNIVLVSIFVFLAMIFAVVFLSEKGSGFVYLYLLAACFISIIGKVAVDKANRSYQERNEIINTKACRYIIDNDKIRLETAHSFEETKIGSLFCYLENEQRYLLAGPDVLYVFPKKEIEKLVNKDEFYQWIAIMKKQLGSPTK